MRIIRCCHKYYVNMGMKSELAALYMCAGDLWDVDKEEWEYEPVLIKDAETNTVHVKFQQVPPEHLREEIFAQAAQMSGSSQDDKERDKEEEKESDPQPKSQESAEEKPQFGARPYTTSTDFDFETELKRLPFTINIGEAPLTREQQACFINLIYEYQEVFSLFHSDLGYCGALKHSIPTTTDKPVYLPHRQILVQLQQEVRKCLESWLKTRHNKAFQKSLCISGSNRMQKDWRKSVFVSIVAS